MNINDIGIKYGEEKLEQLLDMLHDWPVSVLVEELLETWSEDDIAGLMRNFNDEEQ